jgi:hypothetical protein
VDEMERMEQTMNKTVIREDLEHPDMRGSLVTVLSRLSKRAYQEKYWCDPTAKHFLWDNFRMVWQFFEDIQLTADSNEEEGYRPIDQIGYSIRSEEELEIVLPVAKLLERVLKEIGQQKPDSVYLSSPIWEELIQASAKAFQYIKDQGLDEKYVSWAEAPRPEDKE